MADCKTCGMSYDRNQYQVCPYCGEESGEDSVINKEMSGSGAAVKESAGGSNDQKEKNRGSLDSDKRSAASSLKYIITGAVVLAIIAAVIYAIFAFSNSGITVPDKYPTIQEAIDAAEDGDVIVVQVGVYRENLDFRGKNITLQSVDPDDEAIVEETIIDGGGSGTVVSFRSGEGEGAVLSGLTITRGSGVLISGGSSPVIEKCVIEDNNAEFGAGIAIFDSAPTIRNNTIRGNSGFLGGGLYIEESSPLIENNLITGNRAEMGSGLVIISNSAPELVGNSIDNNTATRLGGGVVVAVYSTPAIRDNSITNNRAELNGGGLLIEESEPSVEDNFISANRAANGGGIFVVNTLSKALVIRNNNISDNLSYIAGGGLYLEGSSPTVENNEFKNNISEYLGGGAAINNSAPFFGSNIFENNQAQDVGSGGAVWISENSVYETAEPDTNRYTRNVPDDLFQQ